ncbi:SymE family type I addiction module toxin [Klebsiella oxytoca]|uniref:SymE family type I addiction module toxin n=1 Tax=Klebsiella oxytoca TaxID=571 RepID=UPI00259565EC|nr:SymE family type I addiction module toxin [Klebsiella oxytoca]MDM4654434.1 SymE family type I addiction module toxin [Klebsiella oxytoca]
MTEEKSKPESPVSKPCRHLKVGYIRRKTRKSQRGLQHSSLNLNGDWLEAAGFPLGTTVKVLVMQGKLIIQAEGCIQ